MRSYARVLKHHYYRHNAAYSDAFFLDTGNITGGERRKKTIALPSYRTSLISFVDKKILKKDLNSNFYVQHPELEVREVKLTHLRKIKNELLVYALEDKSPLELVTMAHAYWYFERLVVRGMVSKYNRKVICAVCVLLAIKFVETGDVRRKTLYFRDRWRRFHGAGGVNAMLGKAAVARGRATAVGGGGGSRVEDDAEEEDDDAAQVQWSAVEQNEFRVYVGLDFTLLPEVGCNVVDVHMERLLQQINVTPHEYYSRRFVTPVHLNNYNYYSNLYY